MMTQINSYNRPWIEALTNSIPEKEKEKKTLPYLKMKESLFGMYFFWIDAGYIGVQVQVQFV